MIRGLDTGFLVSAEVAEHPDHAAARATLSRLLAGGDRVALAPQVLAEFIHVVTDPRRFSQPLDMTGALRLPQQWWTARQVDHVFPDDDATQRFLTWLDQLRLGRKRLLDTLLAPTYRHAGIQSWTATPSAIIMVFQIVMCEVATKGAPPRSAATGERTLSP